jgi:hypothetical protein
MSAHTLVSARRLTGFNSEDGTKAYAVEFTGSASYDTGGSVLDVSSLFDSQCNGGICQQLGGVLQASILPTATTAAPSTLKVMLIDKDGTQESSTDDMSGTTYVAILYGKDA